MIYFRHFRWVARCKGLGVQFLTFNRVLIKAVCGGFQNPTPLEKEIAEVLNRSEIAQEHKEEVSCGFGYCFKYEKFA